MGGTVDSYRNCRPASLWVLGFSQIKTGRSKTALNRKSAEIIQKRYPRNWSVGAIAVLASLYIDRSLRILSLFVITEIKNFPPFLESCLNGHFVKFISILCGFLNGHYYGHFWVNRGRKERIR